jgi:4-hydroxy-tetrahydrodipicolinate reductase
VIGTTGWQDQLDEVRALADMYQIGILFSPNFSIGVHLFMRLIAEACKLLSPLGLYDIAGSEQHHRQKQDAPSGTARAIAECVLTHWKGKSSVFFDEPENMCENAFHFSSLRVGHMPGTHTLFCDSANDTITLSHAAKGREGFAHGAILAAEWVKDKKGFYTLEDML